MWRDKKILAIVPARGGSTGVKNKNIRLFNGRPLIYWALDALSSLTSQKQPEFGLIDKIYVSTDSKKIADCVIKYGCGIEVLCRPKQLATDNARVMDTMQWHCCELEKIGGVYDYVIMHHSTAPLVDRYDIHNALCKAVNAEMDFLISMCKSPISLNIAQPVPEDKCVKGWFPKAYRGLNRQELPTRYELDNNIYIGKWKIFRDNVDYWESNIYMYEMPNSKYADIDDESDFRMAEVRQKQLLEADNNKQNWIRRLIHGCPIRKEGEAIRYV